MIYSDKQHKFQFYKNKQTHTQTKNPCEFSKFIKVKMYLDLPLPSFCPGFLSISRAKQEFSLREPT